MAPTLLNQRVEDKRGFKREELVMKHLLGSISQRLSLMPSLLFGIARSLDYEILNRHILDIIGMRNLEGIITQASGCLNSILSYRLFAFALQHDDRLDVWVDPGDCKKVTLKLIEKDFILPDRLNIHNLDAGQDKACKMLSFQSSDLASYVLMDEHFYAKLYLLPGRKVLSYHNDIMGMLTKAIGLAIANTVSIEKLRNEASFDHLTDCYNRREFNRLIEHSIANAQRYGRELSMIMIDIDHFKNINDTHGHIVGDKVLREVSKKLHSELRKSDYIARYGGEEFVVVLPDTKLASAVGLAERLRSALENHSIEISKDKALRATASFGVAALKKNSDVKTLIREADEMLYEAKINGRNMVMPGTRLRLVNAPETLAGFAEIMDRKLS
jgi:diguanylate cyclase (GGDEF)-like protein